MVFHQAIAPLSPPGCPCGGGGICTSNLVPSAIMRWNPIPTPSITARRTPQPMAEFRAARQPPRMARQPPVRNPAVIAL